MNALRREVVDREVVMFHSGVTQRSLICALLLTVVVTGCAASRPKPFGTADVVVESSESLNPAPLNEKLASAAAAGEAWSKSPLLATVELFGGDDDETASVTLSVDKNRGEGADTTTVTMIRDGFLDDSVRGSWNRIVYRRLPDGTWRVVEAKRASRCWRGERLQSYGTGPCP